MSARLAVALAVAFATLAAPAPALGHAVLRGTEPPSGEVLRKQPEALVFRFSEPVEGNFGAMRVFDRRGARAEAGKAFHPGGADAKLAVKLKPRLAKGTYSATYRIISADGHPVSGGMVFSVGKAIGGGASVSDLLAEGGSSGRATSIGFGATRALQYASIALVLGGIVFVLAVWLPGLAMVGGAADEWRAASEAFAARLRRVLLLAIAVGVVSGVLGIFFQGATAAGVSFWSALDPDVTGDVLGTRFGTVWALRVLVWLALGAAVAGLLARKRRPALRPAAVGATGLALRRLPAPPAALALLALPLAFLALSPALSGHASLQSPAALVVGANVVHVVAISVWTGGLVLLLFVLPSATRTLGTGDRTALLAANVARFSTLAGIAFAVLVAAGVVQAIVEVDTFGNLLDTAFGRSVLIKLAIVLGPLLALGAYNRKRSVPALKRIVERREAPGRAGVILRRALRMEVALVAVVFGVTGALVSYPPAVSIQGGPVSVTERLGPADAQLTVDPARIGPNEMHVYLNSARTGTPYDRVKEFTVRLVLPEKDLGPIRQSARKAGPGHYVMDGAVFGVAGDWDVKVEARVSEFDAHYASFDVPVD